jgi:hypothetical protein
MTPAEAGAKGGRGKKAPVNHNSFTEGSGNATYIVRRLAIPWPAVIRGDVLWS